MIQSDQRELLAHLWNDNLTKTFCEISSFQIENHQHNIYNHPKSRVGATRIFVKKMMCVYSI